MLSRSGCCSRRRRRTGHSRCRRAQRPYWVTTTDAWKHSVRADPRSTVQAEGNPCQSKRGSDQRADAHGRHHRLSVEASRHRTELLEPVDAPLHHLAAPIALPVERQRPARPPSPASALIRPLRDGVRDATTAQQPPTPGVAVALVTDHVVGALSGPAPPRRPRHADAVQDGLQLGAVVALPRREHHAQRPTLAVAAKLQLGGQPTPGPAKRLDRVMDDPLLTSPRAGRWRAPAACW